DSGNGTPARPFKTPGKAVSVAKAGDRVILRTGTYGGGFYIPRPITLMSADNEWAVITVPINDEKIGSCLQVSEQAEGCIFRRIELVGGYLYAIKFDSLF